MVDLRLHSASPEQTVAVGDAIARVAQPGDLIALVGELGAGKTQFTRGLARGMGIDPARVSSPTFVLMHEYEPHDAGPVLVHIDAYRLAGADELATLGWEDAGEELRRDAVVAVEWADRVDEALGDDRLDVRLIHEPDARIITLHGRGSWRPRIHTLQSELERHGIEIELIGQR